ncbi:MAG: hypothetical protein ABIJ61_08245 [bacterium]
MPYQEISEFLQNLLAAGTLHSIFDQPEKAGFFGKEWPGVGVVPNLSFLPPSQIWRRSGLFLSYLLRRRVTANSLENSVGLPAVTGNLVEQYNFEFKKRPQDGGFSY